MSSNVLFQPFAKQKEFQTAILSGKYKFLLYGGAIRGGKTFLGLSTIIALCRIFPGSRWAIVRKDLPTLKRNTIPSFEKLKPEGFFGDINRTDWNVKAVNGSEIIFFPESLKDDPELNRWKGLEVNGFLLEEANEISERSYYKAIERAGTWNIPGLKTQPPILVLLTCNPAQNWVKTIFYDPFQTGRLQQPYFYLHATAEDNPYISDDLKESWKSLPETEYKRFVLGDWNISDDPKQLIQWDWLRACEDVREQDENEPYSMGIDVAREGNDRTVFTLMKGCNIAETLVLDKNKLTDIFSIGCQFIDNKKINPVKVGIDAVGMGAGVVDMFHNAGIYVTPVIAGGSPQNQIDSILQPMNVKAEMFWKAKEEIRKGLIGGLNDLKLQADLSSIWYFVSQDKKFRIEGKEELKKRIGRSPDFAESFAICNYVRDNIDQSNYTAELIGERF